MTLPYDQGTMKEKKPSLWENTETMDGQQNNRWPSQQRLPRFYDCS